MADLRKRFSRSARLLTSKDFQRVFAKPIRSKDHCFTVLGRRNGESRARLGLAIAKKHARRAVVRNRIKRLVRENFRIDQRDLLGLDIVILIRPGTALKTNPQLSESLRKHWKNLVRQCEKS